MAKHACSLAFIAVTLAILPAMAFADFPAVGSDGTIAAGTSSAVLGAESWYAGAFPPPGLHLIIYNLYYHADRLKGRGGNTVFAPPFDNYKANAWATVFRPIYVADFKILGANPAWHAVIPFVYKEERSSTIHDHDSGLGDIYVSPLVLGWHRPPWHWAAGLDIIMPTGRYDKDRLTNVGNNHWTFEPALAISYIGQRGFTASTKLMYDIHTPNRALADDYLEGQQFHFDYNVGYAFGPGRSLLAGIGGYGLFSIQNDRSGSHKIRGSRERVFAIGPQLAFQQANWCVMLNVEQEFFARNRPQGLSSWLNIRYSF